QLQDQIKLMSNDTYRQERIYYGIAYFIIIIISFFGNLLVCRICLKKYTKTNSLILSLSISDLLMTVFNIPFNFFRIANFSWPFGQPMCFIVNFVQYLVVYLSSYTMAIIAIQRYQSLTGFRRHSTSVVIDNNHNHNHNNHNSDNQIYQLYLQIKLLISSVYCCYYCKYYITKQIPDNDGYTRRTIYILIIITWLLSALISLLFTYSSEVVVTEDATYLLLFFDQTTLKRCRNPINKNVQQFLLENFSIKPDLFITVTVFVTQYFIPLAIVGYIYIKIGKIIQRQGKLYDNRGNAKARIRQRKKLRRILMLILMVAAFAICWLPLHLFHLLTDAGFLHYNYRIFMMVHWLAMSSVSYNPFIYCWLNKTFRHTAMKILCCGRIECCRLILLMKQRKQRRKQQQKQQDKSIMMTVNHRNHHHHHQIDIQSSFDNDNDNNNNNNKNDNNN
uniref:Probable G-protein coupled receptor 83 n=1 Tax=Dermatophagoides pteronyssinus TaxID=6956 RepID=A0A6P6YEN6_DERPT